MHNSKYNKTLREVQQYIKEIELDPGRLIRQSHDILEEGRKNLDKLISQIPKQQRKWTKKGKRILKDMEKHHIFKGKPKNNNWILPTSLVILISAAIYYFKSRKCVDKNKADNFIDSKIDKKEIGLEEIGSKNTVNSGAT